MSYDREYYEELRPPGGLGRFVDDARDRTVVREVRREVPSGALIDVGCGRGDLLDRFGSAYTRHGVELSETGLAQAVERVPDATFVAADIQSTVPFDGPFDVVTAINVLEHLDDPAAGLANVAAMHRPGGVLVVHLPVIGTSSQARLYTGSYDQDPTHVWRPSGPAARATIETAGYRHLRSAYAPFRPMAILRHVPLHPAWLAVFRRR